MINIKGLCKVRVFQALYNRAKPLGMGYLHYVPGDISFEEAKVLMGLGDDMAQMFPTIPRGKNYFDYVKGRVMKVNLEGDELNEWGYDRDNGVGAAHNALASAGLLLVL